MHMRLSPSTSPHKFPLLQWSLKDWLSLPIYTNRLGPVLSPPTIRPVDRWVQLYGQDSGTVRGLSFWGGFRALHASEKATLRWWQLGLW
ncbi:hypothetical protein BCR43DRAFT_487384 [Syncephalastrum racemosum]|uniref:Uncharacterized protein n=1 Tax=Syncephalastrum racemosum TaxID=13706 RepID=A0A1X2HQP4_SYNRA|nr:hypothetical protein BCR43DRAFT_487384 [Syncephalastrum racemosum]